ncbi:MAG: hypothetical protein ACU0BO_14150 [Limimaricola soesokkakensis]|uniref:hypothetical protein n=1 Tax=Limimaricola soesokkakensis TaxID=1343159 RepID=UPI00405A104A
MVWAYTPRQLVGFLSFAAARRKREGADRLYLMHQAARGDARDTKKLIKEWTR